MGAGVSTRAHHYEVAIKNEIGVLYDAEKKKAFALATRPGWGARGCLATIEAHAKEHDERALDPRKCMFHNLKAFKAAREQIDEIARAHQGDVKKIPWWARIWRRVSPMRPRRRAGRVARRAVQVAAGERQFEESFGRVP